jgi:hypothetical protein
MVYVTLGESCRRNIGTIGQGLDSLIKRGDISLVRGEGGAGRLAQDLVLNPFCKIWLACYKETLTGIAKQELVVYRVLRPYIYWPFIK